MQIKDMFTKDINRDINGVVKVAQDDELSIKQELEEYVITRELKRHFDKFYENYERSLDAPTEKMGVWISGFFGSGKSHFLKILSYLLSNQEVAGKRAVEYVDGKFEDPLVEAKVRRCANVPTEAILFNIDNKGPVNKDNTAIMKVFARVFYEHLGFYGEDLKLARLESHIHRQGKTDEFRSAFERIAGEDWLEVRESYDFMADDVVEALGEALGMSEETARGWIDGSEDVDFSIDYLTNEIKRYVDSKGDNFRLLFMVDEVGQYIGDNVSLMLNLQTIVESLGAKCAGRVWVMVTSQEAIDEVTTVQGNDFSKIQGRFNTRLSLSSSSVDEVIKRRVLPKTETAANLLAAEYAAKDAVLKNLFAFEQSRSDLIGYAGAEDFVETFPFASYQFKLMQDVLKEIRTHGSSGKHLAGGERSMLSGFQEATQAIQSQDEAALVPFWRFYDTIASFLEGHIRRVIDNCRDAAENHAGIEPVDVEVLKLLFLIRYTDLVKSTASNITTLMADAIDVDKMALRTQVQESLDRLLKENYIARNADTYSFLTDEEQDIAREISNERVDPSKVVKRIGEIVFQDIFGASKLRVGKNDFDVDTYVDETSFGRPTGGLTLRVVTVASPLAAEPEQSLIAQSLRNGECLVALADNGYWNMLATASKIDQYTKGKNVSALPESTQRIIRAKNQEKTNLEREAARMLKEAISQGRFFVNGSRVDSKEANAKTALESCLTQMVGSVYAKLGYVVHNVASEAEIQAILRSGQPLSGVDAGTNQRAVDEVESYLRLQAELYTTLTVADARKKFTAAPYGWRELDVAAAIAQLIQQQKAVLKTAGKVVAPDDSRMVTLLTNRKQGEKATLERRVVTPEATMRAARELLKDITESSDAPQDEDGLVAAVKAALEDKRDYLAGLLQSEYSRADYPGRKVVEDGAEQFKQVLGRYGNPTDFLKAFVEHEDGLLDCVDELGKVSNFFNNQRRIWDEALQVRTLAAEEGEYLTQQEVTQDLESMEQVLQSGSPYASVPKLSTYVQKVNDAYNELLNAKIRSMLDVVEATFAEVESYGQGREGSALVMRRAEELQVKRRESVSSAKSLTKLDALLIQLDRDKNKLFAEIEAAEDAAAEEARRKKRQETGTRTTQAQAQPAASAPKIKSLHRTDVFAPERLTSEEEIDAYLAKARQRLLSDLSGNDGIKLR